MTPEEVLKRCDENTIGVVPTLGVTFTGQYEPVDAVSHALDTYQEETGIDIPMHIDGASGGFLAPFCAPDLEWDFRLPRVKSINSSGHKFGLSPLGVGWVVWREAEDLPEDLVFWVNYLGGNMRDIALNFSRPGWQVPAYLLPANCQDQAIQRIMVRHGVSRDLGSLLLGDFKAATISVAFTLIGVAGFLAGSLLMLPETVMSGDVK